LPDACAGGVLLLPAWGVKYVWGWPDRFASKMQEAGSRVVVAEVDSIDEARGLVGLPLHGVMTNRIELVGPWLRTQPALHRRMDSVDAPTPITLSPSGKK
jgi:glycerophosphoryl diester phosphodiesterase